MTEKLYDTDSHLFEFSATVISSKKSENGYLTVLDRTAFFPEGGGQHADTGFIDKTCVFDVKINDGIITHYTEKEVTAGKTVKCVLDKAKRLRNMRSHSAEHIVSGLVHRLYGYDNIGFHLGKTEITLDFNGVLDNAQLREVEKIANECVYENVPVKAWYPDKAELQTLDYRSKKEIKEAVRIVKIGDYDTCACCAPHVKSTGEIGIIKLLECEKYKSGSRLYIKCGGEALSLFNLYFDNLSDISSLLCAKKSEASAAVSKLYENFSSLKKEIGLLKLNSALKEIENADFKDGNRLIFLDDADNMNMIKVANASKNKTKGITLILSGSDKTGYRYVLSGGDENILSQIKRINLSLNGKGGGSKDMIQGFFAARKDEIESFFKTYYN